MAVNHSRGSETNTARASRALRTLQAELSKLCEGALDLVPVSGTFHEQTEDGEVEHCDASISNRYIKVYRNDIGREKLMGTTRVTHPT